jgi:hypothetical protein
VVARGSVPIAVSCLIRVELILLTSAFAEITLLLSSGPSRVSTVKGRKSGGSLHMNPGIALQAAMALLKTKVPRTRGGYWHAIGTLKW